MQEELISLLLSRFRLVVVQIQIKKRKYAAAIEGEYLFLDLLRSNQTFSQKISHLT